MRQAGRRLSKGWMRVDCDLLRFRVGSVKHTLSHTLCLTILIGFGIIGFRDPHGIRPIGFAKRQSPKGTDYMFASESVVCDGCSFSDFEDLKPGEAVIVNKNSTVTRRQLVPNASFSPCIFEYVYFSRPDSIIDGISVYKCRLAMGEALADQVLEKMGPDHDIDVIIPVSIVAFFCRK